MKISRAPIYHTRWQHWALYTHTQRWMGRAMKNSLEIIIKQVCLEGGFERGSGIKVYANCLQHVYVHFMAIHRAAGTGCRQLLVLRFRPSLGFEGLQWRGCSVMEMGRWFQSDSAG